MYMHSSLSALSIRWMYRKWYWKCVEKHIKCIRFPLITSREKVNRCNEKVHTADVINKDGRENYKFLFLIYRWTPYLQIQSDNINEFKFDIILIRNNVYNFRYENYTIADIYKIGVKLKAWIQHRTPTIFTHRRLWTTRSLEAGASNHFV